MPGIIAAVTYGAARTWTGRIVVDFVWRLESSLFSCARTRSPSSCGRRSSRRRISSAVLPSCAASLAAFCAPREPSSSLTIFTLCLLISTRLYRFFVSLICKREQTRSLQSIEQGRSTNFMDSVTLSVRNRMAKQYFGHTSYIRNLAKIGAAWLRTA